MDFLTQPYLEQVNIWPREGRHILAQFTDQTIVVYQAYQAAIGHYAVTHGRLGGPFRYSRMSWIKPNFLWMMYRSGWGTKQDQEMVLALRIRRTFFDWLLSQAVASTWDSQQFPTREDWEQAVARSCVRLQWDPDHHPSGARLQRRALQLGLRGEALEAFGQRELIEVRDLSTFVEEARQQFTTLGVAGLVTPRERVYLPDDLEIRRRIGLDTFHESGEDPDL